MTNRINENEWLVEFDIPPAGGQPDMSAGGPPMSQPGGPDDPMGQQDPNQMTVDQQPVEDEVADDPQYPEMPEENEDDDFEVWKVKFVKESIKGEPNKLIDMLLQVRDRELDPYPKKFVEDNMDINQLRQNSNVFQASMEIRKLIKKDFDRTNPATSVMNHVTAVLDQNPMLNEIYIKLTGLGGGKNDQHRN